MKTYEYTVSTHYLSYIFYCDFGGIEDEDELKAINDLIDEIGKGVVSIKTDEYTGEYQETYFGRCDICGLLSDVVDIEVTHFK